MKTMATQLALLLRMGQQRSNMRLLIKFMLVLLFLFVIYSVLFHVLMVYEGREYSWITGFYWTLTTMSTLGFGDITTHDDNLNIYLTIYCRRLRPMCRSSAAPAWTATSRPCTGPAPT
jgi:Trk-type K+ transport system membrane component